MSDLAIQLKGIRKQYRIGTIGGRTLQADLQSWWAKKRGKEDPNLRIGMDTRLIGQTFWALNGIDLTVKQGERLGIIGANGAGKSTMLKLLARVTAPTEGEIDLWGRVSSMLEVVTGFHGEMTGRENIYMNGAILGMSKAEIDQKMDAIIEFSEVKEFIDTPVKRYSSGMFVKLAFSVAAHLNSEILIMDEVLAVGDMAFQNKCLSKMKEAADLEGKTILYVSHNMQTIRSLCERCIVMDQGKIIYDGEVEEAIGIYMNMGLGNSQVNIQLEKHAYGNREFYSGLTMTSLTLIDKVTPLYKKNESLKLRIHCIVDKPLKNIAFRLTIRNDGDVALGSCWSNKLSFEPGEYDVDFEHSIELLQRGTFYGTIGFYNVDDLGRNLLIDQVDRAFKFEVGGNNMWNPNMRGYIKFKDLESKIEKTK